MTGSALSVVYVHLCFVCITLLLMTKMLPPLQCKRSSCTLFQQTFCERRLGLRSTSFSLILVICMCSALC